MATSHAGGISLHGAADDVDAYRHVSRSAILFKLSQSMLKDLKNASSAKGGLQLVTGKFPKLRFGNRDIDLSLSSDAFRNELYTSTSPSSFTFETVITHRAELDEPQSAVPDTAGADAALAALQNSMASYEQEKKAKSTMITEDVLPEYKNRYEAAKKQKRGGLLGAYPASGGTSPSLSSVGTPRHGLAVTSAPSDSAVRQQAMRVPVAHFLAMKPTTTENIMQETHIPRVELELVLAKIGQQSEGKWKLFDKLYKELNVWDFEYSSQDDRQLAIDNAIRSFDRMRIAHDDKLWQSLLHEKDRGKGIILSKLYLGAVSQSKGLTPNWMPSPHSLTEDEDGPALTPRPGSAHTPKVGAAKTAGSDIKKRLLSKDPKKARAAEEAKEKRKREREAAAVVSDREGRPAKKAATASKKASSSKVAASKIKSAELVHSSDDDDEDGEIKEQAVRSHAKVSTKPALKTKPKPAPSASPDSSDNHVKTAKPTTKAAVSKSKPGTSTPFARATASPANPPTKSVATGKSTPITNNVTSAPPSQVRSQLSPKKPHSRPGIPSPLGAARPRVASDVSDRSAIGVQRARQGAETPKGLGITTGVNSQRRRHDTVISQASNTSSDSDKKSSTDKPRKAATNGASAKAPTANGSPRKLEAGTKRKAEEPLANNPAPVVKHCKTDSAATASHRLHSSSTSTIRTTTTATSTSPDADIMFDSGSSDSAASVIDTITYAQGLILAEKFRKDYYPQYAKLYDQICEQQENGRVVAKSDRDNLWNMHRRLENIKKEIAAAAKREHVRE